MPQTRFEITTQSLITGENFNMDNVNVQVHGEVPEVIHSIMSAMNRHPEVLHIIESSLMAYHVTKKSTNTYIRQFRIGCAVYNEVFGKGNPDKDNKI